MWNELIGKKFKDEENFIWICKYDMDSNDIVFECDDLMAREDRKTFSSRKCEVVGK